MEISNHTIPIIEIKLSDEEIKEIAKNAKSQIEFFKQEIKNLKLIRKQAKYNYSSSQLRLNLVELSTFEATLIELNKTELLEKLRIYKSENI